MRAWLTRPSAQLAGAAVIGPGIAGGLGVLFGLPAFLLLIITAGAAGFFVAHSGVAQLRFSAYAGLAANLVTLIVVGFPFAAGLVADPEFRGALVGLIGVISPAVVVTLGLGAVVGYGGGWIGRDVARRGSELH
jgi:hypothetical protein